jgi:rRNA pseudouridine-1189 N-methylase Emg1 (Nep1/Mra1 family)
LLNKEAIKYEQNQLVRLRKNPMDQLININNKKYFKVYFMREGAIITIMNMNNYKKRYL